MLQQFYWTRQAVGHGIRCRPRSMMFNHSCLCGLVVLSICLIANGVTALVEMRIVDEPRSAYDWRNDGPAVSQLRMRVDPALFSGPTHLRRLFGNCFEETLAKYKYTFCPFSNITQEEQGASWNPFRGVLGVWHSWEISDNKFSAMFMENGDQCGVAPRKSKVKFICGKENKINKVTETAHCEYELIFETALVCHNDSMLVYPVLNSDQQTSWNRLLTELNNEELTEKGYRKALVTLWREAGLVKDTAANPPEEKKEERPAEVTQKSTGKYNKLDQCNTAYAELELELEQTKAQLARFV